MNELREMSTMLFGINLITMVAVVLSIGIAPLITRKSLLFGVRIPEEAASMPKVIKLKKNYINTMIVGGILIIVILVGQYLLLPDISLLATLYLPLVMIALQFIVFVSSWRKATELKMENNWSVPMTATVDTVSAVQREQIWSFPKGWYVVSGLIVIAIIVLSLIKYPSLPAQIPTHWSFDMQPDAWSDKTIWKVMTMPIIILVTIIAMMLGNIVVYRMKLQVSAEHPELSYAQHRVYRKMMSEAIGIMTLVLTAFSALLQLLTIDVFIPSTAIMVVMTILMIIASCVPFTYVYVKAGQGGCKLKPEISVKDVNNNIKNPKTTLKFNRGDDKFWKLGMFYYNENDPAMLVEDRFGTNSGFNYARTSAKIVVALLIIMTMAVYIGTTIIFIKTWL